MGDIIFHAKYFVIVTRVYFIYNVSLIDRYHMESFNFAGSNFRGNAKNDLSRRS